MCKILLETTSVAGTGGTKICGVWATLVFAGQPPKSTDVNDDLCFLLCLRVMSM